MPLSITDQTNPHNWWRILRYEQSEFGEGEDAQHERGHQDTFKGFLRSGNDYSPRGHQVAIDFE